MWGLAFRKPVEPYANAPVEHPELREFYVDISGLNFEVKGLEFRGWYGFGFEV